MEESGRKVGPGESEGSELSLDGGAKESGEGERSAGKPSPVVKGEPGASETRPQVLCGEISGSAESDLCPSPEERTTSRPQETMTHLQNGHDQTDTVLETSDQPHLQAQEGAVACLHKNTSSSAEQDDIPGDFSFSCDGEARPQARDHVSPQKERDGQSGGHKSSEEAAKDEVFGAEVGQLTMRDASGCGNHKSRGQSSHEGLTSDQGKDESHLAAGGTDSSMGEEGGGCTSKEDAGSQNLSDKTGVPDMKTGTSPMNSHVAERSDTGGVGGITTCATGVSGASSNVGGVTSKDSNVDGVTRNPIPADATSDNMRELMARIDLLEREKSELLSRLETGKEKEASFQEIARELERKCFSQQERIESLELESDKAAEKAQQNEKELLLKVDQASAEVAAAREAKDGVIGKLGTMQEEHRKLIDQLTDKDKRVRELSKEIEKLEVLGKKQRAEVLKLQCSLEKSEARCTQLTQDLSKEKEEVSSLNIKVKWAQNKLKAETEAHKTVKSQLEVTTKRLKQSKEEGEQIRADLKQMIQQYQESEDMKSNSLDIQLKKTERELKQHEQEIADQQELHELTVKELELTKNAHKISQEEIQHHKQKISEMTTHATTLVSEIDELKGTVAKQKQENRKLASELSELEQRTQGFEKERTKFAQLREVFTQLQKSNQHLEKELEKRKERETELLAFSAKLSSSNAELTAERADWEAKVASLSSERDAFAANLTESKEAHSQLEENFKGLHESSQTEMSSLLDQLDAKTKAVEQLSMALEDERELVKATKKRNLNIVKDLQKQLQSSKRRIESLEASLASDKEPPATLPISRASSHSSLDGIMTSSAALTSTSITSSTLHPSSLSTPPTTTTTATIPSSRLSPQPAHHSPHDPPHHNMSSENSIAGPPAMIALSDEERAAATPSPEYSKFGTMDQEKLLLVEKLCTLKKELVKQEEKVDFFEEHIAQLTEDIQKKSRIIQNFIMREQSGALAPPSFDENRLRQAKKGGVMGTVFAGGKNSRVHKPPELNLELSLEMNKKMQSVLEDTLLKNITLKENIDTLGKEIQRISAQLQTYEKHRR